MAVWTFTLTAVYASSSGSLVRTVFKQSGTVTRLDGSAVPAVTQDGSVVQRVATDGNGSARFTIDRAAWGTSTGPEVLVTFGSHSVQVKADEYSEYLASIATGASASSIDAHLGGDATNLVPTVTNKLSRNGRLLIDPTSPTFGAVGDGTTNDTAAIQAAIDYAAGFNGVVTFPTPTVAFRIVGSLQMKRGVTLVGQHRYGLGGSTGNRHLVGDGVNPIIVTGTYPGGDSLANRDLGFYHLSMRNNGAACIRLYTAINWTIEDCVLDSFSVASTDSATIEARYSYRGRLKNSSVSCSGGGWAVDLRDNCNGVEIDHNVLTGGALGGAVNFTQSQSVQVTRNIVESSKVGIVAAGPGTGAGSCYGCKVDDNYVESAEQPISVGQTSLYRGGSVSRNFIGNSASTFTPTFGLRIGRLHGATVEGNSAQTKGTEPLILVAYLTAATPPAPSGCQITGNTLSNGTGALYDLTAYSNVITRATFAGNNRVDTATDGTQPATGYREWLSPPITANVGMTQAAIALDPTYGGWVDGVDVIEANGTIACSIDLGTTASATEVTTFDPSTLTLAQRGATKDLSVGFRAGSSLLARVTAGAGTGTFRFRVRWHGR